MAGAVLSRQHHSVSVNVCHLYVFQYVKDDDREMSVLSDVSGKVFHQVVML